MNGITTIPFGTKTMKSLNGKKQLTIRRVFHNLIPLWANGSRNIEMSGVDLKRKTKSRAQMLGEKRLRLVIFFLLMVLINVLFSHRIASKN